MSDVLEPKEVAPEDKYHPEVVFKDPNMPRNPEDPNDKIRAEGPEVADPSAEAAHQQFVDGGGAEATAAANLEAAAAIKRSEGDVEGAEKLEADAASKREEADKKRTEASTAKATSES